MTLSCRIKKVSYYPQDSLRFKHEQRSLNKIYYKGLWQYSNISDICSGWKQLLMNSNSVSTWKLCRILWVDSEGVKDLKVSSLHLDDVVNCPGLRRHHSLREREREFVQTWANDRTAEINYKKCQRASSHPGRVQSPLTVHTELVLVLTLRQIHDGHKVFLTVFERWHERHIHTHIHTQRSTLWVQRSDESNYLLLSGILLLQLLKEPDTKTSLASPDHLNTVGLACGGGLLLSLSRSCCHARNSWISCGAWTSRH